MGAVHDFYGCACCIGLLPLSPVQFTVMFSKHALWPTAMAHWLVTHPIYNPPLQAFTDTPQMHKLGERARAMVVREFDDVAVGRQAFALVQAACVALES